MTVEGKLASVPQRHKVKAEASSAMGRATPPPAGRAAGRSCSWPIVHRCEWGRGDGPAAGQQLPAIVEQHDTVAEQAPTLLEMGSHDACGAVVRRQSVRAAGLMLAHVDLQLENDLPCCCLPRLRIGADSSSRQAANFATW
jgi:hypothetical protein